MSHAEKHAGQQIIPLTLFASEGFVIAAPYTLRVGVCHGRKGNIGDLH